MYHHSNVPYAEAKSEAAREGRRKMQAIIDKGVASAEAVVRQVESVIPKDTLARACVLRVAPYRDGSHDDAGVDGFNLTVPGMGTTRLHEHALFQVSEKAGFDAGYLRKLRDGGDDWRHELITHNLNTLLSHSESRHLIRTVENGHGPEVRGFLSDQYKRIDARPLMDSFMAACKEIGAVPIDGYALPTKVRMRVVLPIVFEPIQDEVLLFGASWGTSDFGDGANAISEFMVRVKCTNKLIGEDLLRQVHLGKKLEENIEWSRRTLAADTQASVLKLRDVMNTILAPAKVNERMHYLTKAAEIEVGEADVVKLLKAKNLNKGEVEQVAALFNGPDVENLPPGNSAYRLSNAVSFFAQSKNVSEARRLDLERTAGELIPHGKAKPVEV